MNDDHRDDEYDDNHASASDFGHVNLADALNSLSMLGDDLYLRMQANNVGAIDSFLNHLESENLKELIDRDRTPAGAFFLQAQTQMWIFALYEMVRTWRARADKMVKWHDNRMLDQMISKYSSPLTYRHFNREAFARQLASLRDDPNKVAGLRTDLLKTEQPFVTMELVRMSLAKHENAKIAGSIAYAPGYARIDRFTGSMQYQISNDFAIFQTVSRQQIASSFRAVPDSKTPSDEEQEQFRSYLKMVHSKDDPFGDAQDPFTPGGAFGTS